MYILSPLHMLLRSDLGRLKSIFTIRGRIFLMCCCSFRTSTKQCI